MTKWCAIVVALALSTLVASGAAVAKPQGRWDVVTVGEQSPTSQIGLYRTPDQVLHVAWQRRTGGNSYDLLHTGIDASGRLRAPTPIVTAGSGSSTPR